MKGTDLRNNAMDPELHRARLKKVGQSFPDVHMHQV